MFVAQKSCEMAENDDREVHIKIAHISAVFCMFIEVVDIQGQMKL